MTLRIRIARQNHDILATRGHRTKVLVFLNWCVLKRILLEDFRPG